MTYATLHTRSHGTATLAGPELNNALGLVGELAAVMLRPASIADRLRSLLPAEHFLRNVGEFDFADLYAPAFSRREENLVVHRGMTLSVADFQINTAMCLAADPLRLLLRIALTGERHCWVAGADRARVADLIEHGLRVSRVLRPGMGWATPLRGEHSLVSLLRAADDEPAVFSHSYGSEFPDQDFGTWRPTLPAGVLDAQDLDEDQWESSREAWNELDDDAQWEHSLAGLVDYRRLDPADLLTPFGHGLSVMDLHAPSWEQSLDFAARY
ncbi:hypothetical protein ABZ234_08140 [Nocardiopsis sp. NPDC006198]|uniref:hypothetical protein n=1 Tax=Nocardiopsis sp. NPDC006198 TaxID=3154472 RepID=UPI0033AEE70F